MTLRMPRASTLRAALLLSLVAGLVGCDHATKLAAVTALRDRPPVSVVPGFVDLAYTQNHDVAFNALERLQLHPPAVVLAAIAGVVTLVVAAAWLRRRRAASPLAHAGFALVLGGALGNVLDRILRGGVVDFIRVRWWPVFNVADVAVVIGVALMLLGLRRREEPVRSRP
jgi:signal peptidase II